MRKLLLAVLLTSASLFVPSAAFAGCSPAAVSSVTSLQLVNFSHSTAVISAVIGGGPSCDTGPNGNGSRLAIIKASSGTCSGGGANPISPSAPFTASWYEDGASAPATNGVPTMIWIVGGLESSTSYNICPQVWNLGSSSWVGSGQVTVNTLPTPAVHPAPPIAPTQFSPSFPDISSYYPENTLINGACNTTNWNNVIQNAINRQGSQGTVISLKNSMCMMDSDTNPASYGIGNKQPDMNSILSSNVTPDGGTVDSSKITTTNCCNFGGITGKQLNEGDQIILGLGYNNGLTLPDAQPMKTCTQGLELGYPYYVHLLSANSFSLYCGSPKASGGDYLALTSQGNSNGTTLDLVWVESTRRSLNWIIVDGGVDDAHFVPEHTRVTPALGVTTGGFAKSYVEPGTRSNSQPLLAIPNADGTAKFPMGKIWFRGIQITDTWPEISFDPQLVGNFYAATTASNNIVFDRTYWHFPYGQRVGDEDVQANGFNIAFKDSYFDNLSDFTNYYTGLHGTASGNTLTLASGVAGDTPANSPLVIPGVTITASGSSTGTYEVYADIFGGLDVALPPGVTATCSGYANCNVFTSDSTGGGVEGPAGAFPSGSMTVGAGCAQCMVAVDPVYSASNACSSTENLYGPTFFNGDIGNPPGTGAQEWGTRFTVKSSGFVCAARVYKIDGQTTHTLHLWSDSGTLLGTATTSGETASGWQSVNFGSPIAVTAGTVYRVSFTAAGPVFAIQNSANQNWAIANYLNGNHGTVRAVGYYVANGGGCSINGALPHNLHGNSIGGPIACGSMSGSNFGSPTAGNRRETNMGGMGDDGTNWLVSYRGPGPITFENTTTHGYGLIWHFDGGNGCGDGCTGSNPAIPGTPYNSGADFEIRRSYTWFDFRYLNAGINGTEFQNSSSDGNFYGGRQPWEWKAGNRISFDGNLFDGAWGVGSLGGIAELDAVSTQQGIYDFNFQNNTVQHVNSAILGANPVVGGSPYPNLPTARQRIDNNIFWDIDGINYHSTANSQTQRGDIFLGQASAEDVIITHNVFAGQSGLTELFTTPLFAKIEGYVMRNNFFQLNAGVWGGPVAVRNEAGGVGNDVCGHASTSATSALQWNCMYTGAASSDHNAIIPGNGATQANVQAWWPNLGLSNISNNDEPNSTLNTAGFYKFNTSSLSLTQNGNSNNNQFSFNNSSRYCSGCAFPSSDGTDIGPDMNALTIAQGLVQAINITGITTTAATVNFVAPDTNACRVDYGTDPNIVTFASVTPSSGNRVQHAAISGLTTGTTYYFRVDCQSAPGAPTGTFLTH